MKAAFILRKSMVILIMILPLISYSGCKKQPKCGCGKDILFTITDEGLDYSSIIYTETGTNAYFQVGMDTYYFCNPSEMYPVYSKFKKGDQILISGNVYWECNYLYNASNYSYGLYYKIYQIQVTSLKTYMYGK